MDELRDITDNFGSKALIVEGSYGRVFYGVLKSGQAAAIKKIDPSKKLDQELMSQVYATKHPKCAHHFFFLFLTMKVFQQISTVSRLRHDNVIPLVCYCV